MCCFPVISNDIPLRFWHQISADQHLQMEIPLKQPNTSLETSFCALATARLLMNKLLRTDLKNTPKRPTGVRQHTVCDSFWRWGEGKMMPLSLSMKKIIFQSLLLYQRKLSWTPSKLRTLRSDSDFQRTRNRKNKQKKEEMTQHQMAQHQTSDEMSKHQVTQQQINQHHFNLLRILCPF